MSGEEQNGHQLSGSWKDVKVRFCFGKDKSDFEHTNKPFLRAGCEVNGYKMETD